MFFKIATMSVMSVLLISPAFAGGLTTNLTPTVQTSKPILVGSRESGKERLRKLLRSHSGSLKITQAAKNATGDPNIRVVDRRSLWGGQFRCSYLWERGERIMICD